MGAEVMNMWLALALSVPTQFCAIRAEPAMEVAPMTDVTARTSLDGLDGDAPQNLVVFRDSRAGFVEATLDDLDEAGEPVAVTQSSSTLLQRFEVGALPASHRGALTLVDPMFSADDPAQPTRTIAFASSEKTDVEPPTIDETLHAIEEKVPGGPSMACGPIPGWRDDEWVTSVAIPAASDDTGIAAWELRVTLDGVESVFDVEVEGAGDHELVARTFSVRPERIRVVAFDHAGNASEPAELGHVHGGGCAQAGASSSACAFLLAVLAARSRRFVRRAL